MTDRQISSDINIAHIQVVGVGGLGLVAVSAAVALVLPGIGLSLAIAAISGTALAIAWIVKRGKAGPMPSSSQRAGANTTLGIEDVTPRT
jgi:hypothetical protein